MLVGPQIPADRPIVVPGPARQRAGCSTDDAAGSSLGARQSAAVTATPQRVRVHTADHAGDRCRSAPNRDLTATVAERCVWERHVQAAGEQGSRIQLLLRQVQSKTVSLVDNLRG